MTPGAAAVELSVAVEATEELVAAFARLVPQLSTSAVPPDRSSLARIIAAPSNTILLARDPSAGRKIVGSLTLVVFPIPTGVRAWIEDVVVDASARGRGVGEALTQKALRLALDRGAQTVDLTSRASRQAARQLYEKAGFTVRDTDVYRYRPEGPRPAADTD
jgi:ribosomal protein S18 acetylase RimI-like enzyme